VINEPPRYFYLDSRGQGPSGLFRFRGYVDVDALGQLHVNVRGKQVWRDWCANVIPGGHLRELSQIERDEYMKRGHIEEPERFLVKKAKRKKR
jgi:hypothetical protein